MKRGVQATKFIGFIVLLGMIALPASGLEGRPGNSAPAILNHLSSGVQARYFLTHPDQAEGHIKAAVSGIQHSVSSLAQTSAGTQPAIVSDLFNRDHVGLPQNEESVTVCKNHPGYVVGGTNDYRGLLDPQENFTGWYLSTNGGDTVKNEGLLPAVMMNGVPVASGGDPVTQSEERTDENQSRCNIYAASLNYGPDPFNEGDNGVALYRTTPQILASCPQGTDTDLTHPSCWPDRKVVAQTGVAGGVGHFFDKEWRDVGKSGSHHVVWVTFSDFNQDPNTPLGYSAAQIRAVRCYADLTHCTQPILISGTDSDIQFSDVTIAQDGSTLITWAQINGELEQTAQSFTVKARIAPPGSTTFGPTHIVAQESNPLPFGGALHANDFRTATYPKSIMPMVNGHRRAYVTWDRCRYRVLDTICEEPEILLSHSDNDGATWSTPKTISAGGDNYFPAISDEVGNPNFVIAYYTNRFDPVFHNRQDVEMVTIGAASSTVIHRQRVTPLSNETEADPILGGFFIGDYFDVHLLHGMAYVHYNANYRHVKLLGQGVPVPQQDNYLTKVQS
jgi:hypothetical protein